MKLIQKHWPKLVLVIVFAFGIFFRVADLDSTPPGVAPEEAKIANEALVLAEQQKSGLGDPEGRLYTQLVANAFQQEGPAIETMRFASSIFGILALLGVYLLTREVFRFSEKDYEKDHYTLFGKESTAILATGLMATSFWHISFSRVAVEPILLPVFTAFSLYFILRYLRTRKIWNVFPAGFFVIASLNLYIELFGNNNIIDDYLAGASPIETPIAFLFLLGAVFSVWTATINVKNRKYRTMTADILLFTALIAMVVPALIWGEAHQYSALSLGALPAIVIISSFGFLFFIRALFPHKEHRAEIWPYALGAVVVIVLLLNTAQFNNYFTDWPQRAEVHEVYAHNATLAGFYFNDMPQGTQKYLIANKGDLKAEYPQDVLLDAERTELPINAQTTLFIQQKHGRPVENTLYIEEDDLPVEIIPPAVMVPLEATEETRERIMTLYPGGNEVQIGNLWIYEIE